jgi:hypothetical protein
MVDKITKMVDKITKMVDKPEKTVDIQNLSRKSLSLEGICNGKCL